MNQPEPMPPLTQEGAAKIVDAMLPMLAIAIEPAWRDAVIGNLVTTARAASLVLDFPLDDEVEPAPVFRA